MNGSPFASPSWNPHGNPMSTRMLTAGTPEKLAINTAYIVAHSSAAVPLTLPSANTSAGSSILIKLAQNGESSIDLIPSVAGDLFWLEGEESVQATLPPLTYGTYQLLAVDGVGILPPGDGIWLVSGPDRQVPELQPFIKTVDFTARANKLYLLDASAGNITITAPIAPTQPALAQGDRLALLCSAQGGSNNFIVNVAPNLIWDETSALPGYSTSVTVLANAGTYREWVYNLTDTTWYRVGFIAGDVLT